MLLIQNGIDNYIKITKIKLDSASLNKKANPYKAWEYPKVCVNLQTDVR